jgi:hypothetical protein
MHSSGLHHSLWDAVIVGHSHNQHPDGKFKLPEGLQLSQAQSSQQISREQQKQYISSYRDTLIFNLNSLSYCLS